MSPRVFAITDAAGPNAYQLLGTASISWECAYWQNLQPERLRSIAADVILAVAIPFSRVAASIFQWIRGNRLPKPVLAVLPEDGGPNVEPALSVADDFLLWPARREDLRVRLSRLLGPPGESPADALEQLREQLALLKLIGEDAAFLEIVKRVPRIAQSGAPLLITGETGTGKELFARAVHHLGSRREQSFIPVDCGVLPDHLFENELFGHARGAYTDAHAEQRGLAALAEGGTIFLDEIDALSLAAQAKLLRYLQERTYRPLGSGRLIRSDVSIIAASNQSLESAVRERRFREDLFFRINVLRLHLPPLRERARDIGILARYFLHTLPNRKLLSYAAVRKLESHDWPGNVRELYNVVQRAALAAEDAQILPNHIEVQGLADPASASLPDFREARAETVSAFERTYVADLLRQHKGNVTRAARAAGKERRAFGKLAKKHGIDPRRFTA